MNSLLKAALVGILPAVLVDLRSFSNARRENPSARFDFVLALTNWMMGGVSGLGVGLGIDAMGG